MASYLEKLFHTRKSEIIINPQTWGRSIWYPLFNNSLENLGKEKYLIYFLIIPELNSIINKRAMALTKWNIQAYSKRTGLPISGTIPEIELLNRPNYFQAKGEFWKQSSIYRDIYGNEYLFFLKPLAVNSYKGLFTLDPFKMIVNYSRVTPFYLLENLEDLTYRYNDGQVFRPIDIDKIIHLSDNNVSQSNILLGTSKIKSLQKPLENIIAAYDKRLIALKTPIGVFSNSDNDTLNSGLLADEKELKSARAALDTNGASPIITNLKTRYNAINVNAKTLGLFEEIEEDYKKIAAMYDVPFDLIGTNSSTYENQEAAERRFYTNTIIPEAQERIDALNQYFGFDTGDIELRADYYHLPLFNDDMEDAAEVLVKITSALATALANGAISVAEYREELKKYMPDLGK